MSEPRILDLSAGNRAMWYDKNCPLATFVDIRPEMKPDIVADSRNLQSTVGEGYDLVVFDPPHTNFSKNSDMAKTYGYLTGPEIVRLVKETAREAYRVTSYGAFLIFKWNDRDRSLKSVLEMLEPYWMPLFGQISATRRRRSGSDKMSSTYWITLVRRDDPIDILGDALVAREDKK
mgnify:CR=1 FL=1